MHTDPDLPLIFTRTDALTAGVSRHQVAHRVRTGHWRAPRRGIYVQEHRYAELTGRQQHIVMVRATLMARGGDSAELVVSHLSAATLYDWALPLDGPGPATFTVGNLDAPTRHTDELVVQVAGLPPLDLTTRKAVIGSDAWRLPLTSPARTVADNLRHLPNADGVALADSALRQGRVSYEQVAECLDRQANWPYAENGRRALLLLDPRRETRLDSAQISRWGTSEITGKPRAVLERVEAARRRGDRDGFSGRTAYLPSPAWLPTRAGQGD